LAFERGSLLFVFNLNPAKSYKDYGMEVYPGTYRCILDTDDRCMEALEEMTKERFI
jgi:1,4-alpha-glucan branching enzyme